MKTQNIEQMTAEIDAHRAADLLVQRDYYDPSTGRGCFIGCLAHGDDIAVIAERFGVPEPLTGLLETIFEGLPFDEAADFFSEIPRAIGEDGRDLTKVHWAFLADLLRHLPDTDARDVVADVIAGMDLLAAGQEWSGAKATKARAEAAKARVAKAAEARTARVVAEAAYWAVATVAEAQAADWAARAASWVAKAVAYWATEAAYWARAVAYWATEARVVEIRRQRDAILRLIREA